MVFVAAGSSTLQVDNDGEHFIVDLASSSRDYCENHFTQQVYVNEADGAHYIAKEDDTVTWRKDALKEFKMVSMQMRQADDSNSEYMCQAFTLGLDGRHRFWQLSSLQDFDV